MCCLVYIKMAGACSLEKSRTTLHGNKTPSQAIFTSGSNPELVVLVKGEWEYKDSLLLGDLTLLLLLVYFLCVVGFLFFSQLMGKAGLHFLAN